MNDKIYTITCVSNDARRILGCRLSLWGFFFTIEEAQKAIAENWDDISEMGWYQYAVIAECLPASTVFPTELEWYEFVWDHEFGRMEHVLKTEKPEQFKNLVFGWS